ncbi:glycosyltransferase family 4 protein [Candidatus Methylacidithermus pantelleriae]|uniref:Glycosyltransferase n=1 Tax=Candidatus Methylacidithermus pantelleriae TaxID=2744239 RepID=A0A8J2BKS8_9BACT|nr:glycosyltransferase family 4 protein [Candidatus Methylacidithermus pantelleriae]CAF0694360.1 Glycosyltransferase [Candidatus Methylacidithermus pantelleriae]
MLRVNVAVCGRFHYHNYIGHLAERGLLGRFYYSHRVDKRILPQARESEVNLWLKEYLLRAHSYFLGNWCYEQLVPYYLGLWDTGVLRRWKRADLWHFMLMGTAKRAITRAHEEGAVVVGEAVNAHPAQVAKLLEEEDERLGLKKRSHFHEWHRRLLEEVERTSYLLVASRWIRNSFVSRGYPAERIEIIPYGVDVRRFRPAGRDPNGFRVLCVAQITPRKGHVDLLEAWKILGLKNAELLFFGTVDHEMVPVLERYRGQFRHGGSCSFDQVNEVYNRASVFALASIEDGFSLAVLEAMASGLPVIVTENTGAADMVDPGVNGFVVPIRSPERIGEAIEKLYRDPDRRRWMGENAARKAREKMSWEAYARRLIEWYKRVGSSNEARSQVFS